MTPTRHIPVTVCHVLREDLDLSEAIPIADRDKALEECLAAAMWIPTGPWSAPQTDIVPDGIGLLVLQGLLIRHLRVAARFSSELLGGGDLLRPWQGAQRRPLLRQTSDWRVLEPTRVAVLDGRVARRFAAFPELTGQLVARGLERSRSLAVNMAIVQQPRAHVRVHMMLWHLADRWGYVCPEGTMLPLRLTHDVLADLVAARRPTVSSALAQLTRSGLVRPGRNGWLLLGHGPEELVELQQLSTRGEPFQRRGTATAPAESDPRGVACPPARIQRRKATPAGPPPGEKAVSTVTDDVASAPDSGSVQARRPIESIVPLGDARRA